VEILKGKTSMATAAVVALMARENKQTENRSNSVTINGLAEPVTGGSDEETVKTIFTAIGVNTEGIMKIRRVGRTPTTSEERSRTVVVELHDHQVKYAALENRVKLKEMAEYSKVYIKQDLSDNERFIEYELRKSRNSRNAALPEVSSDGKQRFAIDKNNRQWFWGIRWGELHQIDKATGRAFRAVI
jgi:hypothetical protein